MKFWIPAAACDTFSAIAAAQAIIPGQNINPNAVTGMKLYKKLALAGVALVCTALLLLAGTGLYLYRNPRHIKPLIESSLSMATGASCTINRFYFTFHPLTAEAQGVRIEMPGPKPSLSLEIPSFRAAMRMEGPFGGRALIVESVKAEGVSLSLAHPVDIFEKRAPGTAAEWLRDLAGFLFFRDVRIESVEVIGGHARVSAYGYSVEAGGIRAEYGSRRPLGASFSLSVRSRALPGSGFSSDVELAGGKVFDPTAPELRARIRIRDGNLMSPWLRIGEMAGKGEVLYRRSKGGLAIAPLSLSCSDIVLAPGVSNLTGPPLVPGAAESLSLETGLFFHPGAGETALSKVDCAVTGLSLQGPLKDWLFPMNLRLRAETVSRRGQTMEIRGAALTVPEPGIRFKKAGISSRRLRLIMKEGHIRLKEGEIEFPGIDLEGFGLNNLQLSAQYRNGRFRAELEGRDTGLFRAASEYSLIPGDYDFSGRDAVFLEAAAPAGGALDVQCELSISDLSFSDTTGSLIGQGISLASRIRAGVDPRQESAEFSFHASAESGETLFDRFYFNLAENPFYAACNGLFYLRQRLVQISESSLELKGILPVAVEGAVEPAGASPTGFDLRVRIPRTPSRPIFSRLVKEPFGMEQALLSDLAVAGDLSMEFGAARSERGLEVKGALQWQDGTLTLEEKTIIREGAQLDLPIWYHSGSAADPEAPLSGRLSLQSAALPLLPSQPLEVSLQAMPNRLSTDSAIVIQTPGGPLRLGPVRMEDLFAPDRSLHTRLSFDDIQIDTLLPKGAAPAAKGTIAGTLDPVRYSNHTLTADGRIRADVFGGTLSFQDISASGLFTPAPVFKLDAHWKGLRLSRITTRTPFGKIEGVLNGRLQNFEFAYGQPQAFDLVLETVQKKGVPQTISVQAVENIARIGGGQSPFMGLTGIFMSLFETFPYRKIGIRASLENDIFTINGTIRENGTEFLVKRGTFSGVNVVNQNPDNRIRFKDMVNRIQRITRGGKPVIE